MVAVAVVIPIEKFVQPYAGDVAWLPPMTLLFIAWAFIEEITKFLAAYVTVLRRAEDDEPIDPVIYMVTTALGFAAAENTLFLLSPLAGSTVFQTLITGNLRFVGATLLHVLSSAVIGLALALAFYAKRNVKRRYAFIGVLFAGIVHSIFNFFIINTAEEHLLRTFAFVWVGIIVLLAVLEFVKRIKPRWT
ncbi:MAG: hypothetical protein JWM46_550 [Candidatus Kaiserbacteria bacterium]|nr:hypothetical protein [Candidatus Kaiserbacteria bacterium]